MGYVFPMNILRRSRSSAFRRALLGTLAVTALTLTACGDDGGDSRDRDGDRRTVRPDRDPEPTLGRSTNLREVDPSEFRIDGSDMYSFLFSVDGTTESCFFDDAEVICSGTAHESVPDLTGDLPGRPNAIEATGDGLRYTILGGRGGHEEEVRLDPGQIVTLGDVTCGAHDSAVLECTAGEGIFTIVGRDAAIRTEGRVLPEPRGKPDSATSESTRTVTSGTTAPRSTTPRSTTPRTTGSGGGSGFVTEVDSGGRTVTASAPSCDGRGILILESVVEEPGVDTADAIAAALERYPGSAFTTPGHCPSLRASLDGADVYPVYVDHGGDTSALCADKAARGGNARVLSDRNEYVDPC